MCSKLLFFNKLVVCGLVGLFGFSDFFFGGGALFVWLVGWFGLVCGLVCFFLLLNTDNGLLEARAGKPPKALFCR